MCESLGVQDFGPKGFRISGLGVLGLLWGRVASSSPSYPCGFVVGFGIFKPPSPPVCCGVVWCGGGLFSV